MRSNPGSTAVTMITRQSYSPSRTASRTCRPVTRGIRRSNTITSTDSSRASIACQPLYAVRTE